MKRRHITNFILFIFIASISGLAWGSATVTQQDKAIPCATVEDFSGDGDILSATRQFQSAVESHRTIDCLGWVSVKKGYLVLRHREGQVIHLSEGALAQLNESNPDGKKDTDQLVLVRGEAFVETSDGSVPFRVVTAQSRARLDQGQMFVLYSLENDESQVFAISGKVSFENRFVTQYRMEVRPGEVSAMNLESGRVIPSHPQAVALATMKPKFAALNVDPKARDRAIKTAKNRNQKIFSKNLLRPVEARPVNQIKELEAQKVQEALAAQADAERKASYQRHETRLQIERVNRHVVQRSVAGMGSAAGLLNPVARSQSKGAVEVIDMEKRQSKAGPSADKKKLIEELSKIKED